jgi:hypothetical protein
MLFHITHVHTPETCPYHNPEKARDTFGKVLSNSEQLGVKLHGAWVDAPAHTVYLVVETDSAQKIEELLSPAFEIGHAETRIVTDAMDIIKRRTREQ